MTLNANYGKVFQRLRESKGFSIREIVGDVASVSQVSKFERGDSNLTIDKFFKLLFNINSSPAEFWDLLNQRDIGEHGLMFQTEMADAYSSRNISHLEIILAQMQQEVEREPEQNRYRLDVIIVKAVIFWIDSNRTLSADEVSTVENYLLSLKGWGRYDVDLLGWVAPTLGNDVLFDLVSAMISPTQYIGDPYRVDQSLLQTVLNAFNVFIKRDALYQALSLANYFNRNHIRDHNLYEKQYYLYCKYLLAYKQGDKSALENLKQLLLALQILDSYETADILRQEIENLVTSKPATGKSEK